MRKDGVYLISPDRRCPFRVYCDMDDGGWTLIQRHADGKVNFYRSWKDYVTGFGRLNYVWFLASLIEEAVNLFLLV